MAAYDGKSGSFAISPTGKIGSDFRSKGRSQYVKGHYLRHAGSGINWRLAMCQSPSMVASKLGFERKLYCRAMIARFSQELGGNWNLGEENTQSSEEQIDMIRFLNETDPYKHNIVIHTFPNQQDKVYTAWLGSKSLLTGASLQNGWSAAHPQTLKWLRESSAAGRPWVVCNDEQNPASDGVPADPVYEGMDGFAIQNGMKYNLHDVRKRFLWGTLIGTT